MRLLYRLRQFWSALTAHPAATAQAIAQATLTPAQLTLFNGLQPSEQAHALHIFRQLLEQGEAHPDLLVAALLHDAGKQRCPLRPWERALIVLVSAISPTLIKRWGSPAQGEAACSGWRRQFVVAEQHAEWGAEMARQAGCSSLAVSLIRRHQQPVPPGSNQEEDNLLRKLQVMDNES